jgi:hypothetical protein
MILFCWRWNYSQFGTFLALFYTILRHNKSYIIDPGNKSQSRNKFYGLIWFKPSHNVTKATQKKFSFSRLTSLFRQTPSDTKLLWISCYRKLSTGDSPRIESSINQKYLLFANCKQIFTSIWKHVGVPPTC